MTPSDAAHFPLKLKTFHLGDAPVSRLIIGGKPVDLPERPAREMEIETTRRV